MRKFLTFVLFAALGALFVPVTACGACQEVVPAGHVGRVRTSGGFTGEILRPGNHAAWGRDELYLMQVGDASYKVPMSVLCEDKLNFKFDVDVLVAVNMDDPSIAASAFESLAPADAANFRFTTDQLFQTYVLPVVDQESRKVVSRYTTHEIVSKRPQIIEEVRAAVTAVASSPLIRVKRVTVGNLDFPDVITRAQEAKAQRQVEIETAKAEAEKQKAVAEGQLALARVEAQRTILRAQAQADANKILASSVSPQLLQWRQWDVLEDAAGGANNMFLVPYTDANHGGLDTAKWLTPQGILDADLLERINDAKNAAGKSAPAVER